MVDLSGINGKAFDHQSAIAMELYEKGDFDSAYAAFENILNKDKDNTSARWMLLLCRYGIQYVWDELTERNVATVNRMRYDDILEDPDLAVILSTAAPGPLEQFRKAAEEIHRIQERYLEIIREEKPYDVFISFKAENDGVRSRDSIIGQEIYERLQEHGLRVFYSRISLQEKSGREYEPFIFSALSTAKVMILVGTSVENMNAGWVRNEWKRYLALMQTDHDRNLIPVYEGMSREAIPEEIPVREAIDYAQPGALFDLVQGVLTITGRGIVVDTTSDRNALLKLSEGLRTSVEQGSWNQAKNLANEILDLDPENGDAYFYLLLAEYQVNRPTLLAELDEPWMESRYYQRTLRYASEGRRQMLEAICVRTRFRQEQERRDRALEAEQNRQAKELEDAYNQALEQLKLGMYSKAEKILTTRALHHPQANELQRICRKCQEAERLVRSRNLLTEQLKEQYGAQYNQVRTLHESWKNQNDSSIPGFEMKHILGGIAVIIFAFWAYKSSMNKMIAALIGSAMVIFSSIGSGIGDIFFSLGMLPSLLFAGLAAMIAGSMDDGITMLVIPAAPILLTGLVNFSRAARKHAITEEYREYVTETISPLEEKIWEEFQAEYGECAAYGVQIRRPASEWGPDRQAK